MMRVAADLHLGAVRFVDPGQRIVVMTATAAPTAAAPATTAVVASSLIAITPPHALVLSVSHGLPVAGSCLRRFPAGSFTQLSPAFQVLLSKSCFPESCFPSPAFQVLLSKSCFPSPAFQVLLSKSCFPSPAFQVLLSKSCFPSPAFQVLLSKSCFPSPASKSCFPSPAFQVLLSKSCFPSPNGQAVPRWSDTSAGACRLLYSDPGIRSLAITVVLAAPICWPRSSRGGACLSACAFRCR